MLVIVGIEFGAIIAVVVWYIISRRRRPRKIEILPGLSVEPKPGNDKLEEDIRMLVMLGEHAYDKMYDSHNPKDERDDALMNFDMAIKLAHRLGLTEVETALRQRYEHIEAVFNSQFRGL